MFPKFSRDLSPGAGEIAALTSLRGVAAVGVLLLHFRNQFGPTINPDRFTHFFVRSYLFVDFFFILSGFVIALSYGSMFSRGINLRDYIAFLIKRLARIYPLHIVLLVGFVVSESAKYLVATNANPPFSVNTGTALLANVLLVQSWGFFDYYTWNHPAWSISTEWFAYILFPVLTLGLFKIRGLLRALLIALGCCILLYIYFGIPEGPQLSYFLLRCVPSFVLGMVIFRLPAVAPAWITNFFAIDVIFALTLAAAFFGVFFEVPDLLVVIAFFFVVLAGSLNRGALARALSVRPLYFLGVTSYSIYMIHTLVLRVWQMLFQVVWHGRIGFVQALAAFFTMMAIVLLASMLTYYCIEAPGRVYFGKFARRRAQPGPVAPPIDQPEAV